MLAILAISIDDRIVAECENRFQNTSLDFSTAFNCNRPMKSSFKVICSIALNSIQFKSTVARLDIYIHNKTVSRKTRRNSIYVQFQRNCIMNSQLGAKTVSPSMIRPIGHGSNCWFRSSSTGAANGNASSAVMQSDQTPSV